MDIGELNSIRRTVSTIKLKTLVSANSISRGERRPSVDKERGIFLVKQQLGIERKLFLLNSSKGDAMAGSQVRGMRIRNIINNANL
jgi:hypothetical protein